MSEKECYGCWMKRMGAASSARIMAGTGLTYPNAEEYSEEYCPHSQEIRDESWRKANERRFKFLNAVRNSKMYVKQEVME